MALALSVDRLTGILDYVDQPAPGSGRTEARPGADDLARQLAGRFVRNLFGLGMALGGLIAVYAALWSPIPAHGISRTVDALENLAGVAAGSLAAAGYFRRRFRRRLTVLLGWIDRDGQPLPAEREGLVRLPGEIARIQFGIATAAAIGVATWNAVNGAVGPQWARALVGIVLFGLILTALTYLLAERALRPAYALALTREEAGRAIGVRSRLLVAWAVGSGVPFLFIVTIPLRGSSGRLLSMSVPVVFMGFSGLIMGMITTSLAAGSVADPLRRVRRGLRQVEEGDLEVELGLEDAGEVGLLQASFNSMVVGLRERRQLQDVFGRHVGAEVARKALEIPVRLGGELRGATVVFVDLVGSTALAEARPPEQVVELLNAFFAVVVEEVEAEEGWVDKFEGDGALAVFGVPVIQDDHSARALRAVRALKAGVSNLGVAVGIGVATGEVVAGNIGTERRHEFTVIGRPVNQAARLADLAKESGTSILVNLEAVNVAGEEARHWVSLDPVLIRGIDTPLPVATMVDPGQRV